MVAVGAGSAAWTADIRKQVGLDLTIRTGKEKRRGSERSDLREEEEEKMRREVLGGTERAMEEEGNAGKEGRTQRRCKLWAQMRKRRMLYSGVGW